jgi:hypothetical protein
MGKQENTQQKHSVRVSKEPLPKHSNITTYVKDWLQGYKEVSKTNPKF